MAGGLYRGTAFAELVQAMLRSQYYGGFEKGGEFGKILSSLAESSEPIFEDIMSGYWGELAREGQAVPGEGISGAGYEGFEDLMKEYAAELTGTALEAYGAPWGYTFSKAPESTAKSALEVEKARGMTQGSIAGIQTAGNICGFAFVEADDGLLNRIARRYQDEEGTIEQRIGYKIFCLYVVPLMKKYRAFKFFIKWSMVRPLIWWGKAFYGENWHGHIFYPFKWFWLTLFESIGKGFIRQARIEIKRIFQIKLRGGGDAIRSLV